MYRYLLFYLIVYAFVHFSYVLSLQTSMWRIIAKIKTLHYLTGGAGLEPTLLALKANGLP